MGWVRGGVGAATCGERWRRRRAGSDSESKGSAEGRGVGQARMGESSSGDPHPRPHRAAAGLHGRWRATHGRAEPRSLSHRPCRCESLGGGAWRMRGEACARHARRVACARSRPLYLSPVPCAADVADAIPMRQHRPCCGACLRRVSAFDSPASVNSANDRCRCTVAVALFDWKTLWCTSYCKLADN